MSYKNVDINAMRNEETKEDFREKRKHNGHRKISKKYIPKFTINLAQAYKDQ